MTNSLFNKEYLNKCIHVYKTYIKNKIEFIWNIGKIYIIWVIIYFSATQLYQYFCVPFSFMGFMVSPILVTAPYCIALRWCIVNGAEVITSMWLILGSWLVGMLVTTTN